MILTVLIGNTNTRLTWFGYDRVRRRLVIPSARVVSELPSLTAWLDGHVAVASVVPRLTDGVVKILAKLTGRLPFVVGPRTRTGIRFRYRRHELGTDRVCLTVGAFEKYCLRREGSRCSGRRRDCVVIDFGTATTVNIVHGDGTYLGGAILPGMRMMLDSLADGTAQLPRVSFGLPRLPYGHSTVEAIRAGVANLITGGVEHIVADIGRVTGRRYYTVATGGNAGLLRQLKVVEVYDEDIAAYGLLCLYRLNRLKGRSA